MDDARHILTDDVRASIAYLPHLVGALIILAVGTLVAWIVGRIIRFLLARAGLDELGQRRGLTEDLERIGIRTTPSRLVGGLVFLVGFIAALNQSIDTLELASLSAALHNLLNYMPHVLLALVVMLLGVIVADALAHHTAGAMSRAGVLYHATTGGFVRTAIIVVAALIALQQLTIDSTLILSVVLVFLAAGALAAGIAGGWGARNLAENLVARRFIEGQVQVGDSVDIGGITGIVVAFGPTSVVVRDEADARRTVVIPNATFAQSTFAKKSADVN